MFAPTRKKSHSATTIACLLISLCYGWLVHAAPAENTNEIQIRADYMKFDLETGDSIYEGNVSIVQGGIRLTGEQVIIQRDPGNNREISEINVTGKPARYLQDENTASKVHAESQQMKYSTRENRLVMTDNARLEQSDQLVESQRIVYDTEKKVIIAGKEGTKKSPGDRVNITLTPKKTSPNENH